VVDIKGGLEHLVRTFVQSKNEIVDVIEKQIAGRMEVTMKSLGRTTDEIEQDFKKLNPRFAKANVLVEEIVGTNKKMVKVIAQIDPTIRNMVRGMGVTVSAGFNKFIRNFDFSALIKSGFAKMQSAFISVGNRLNADAARLRASNGRFMSETTAKVAKLVGVGMIALSGVMVIIGALKPVQTIISSIQGVIQAIFLPLGLLLMALLLPVLILLAALLRTNLYKEMMKFVTGFISVLIPIVQDIANFIVSFINIVTSIKDIIAFIRDLVRGAVRFFSSAYGYLTGVFHPILSAIYSAIKTLLVPVNLIVKAVSGLANFGGGVSNFFGGIMKGIASLDSGGSIVSSGLAVVHRGETVIPAGRSQQGNINNEIHIHINGMDSSSAKNLAEEIMRQIENRTGKSLRWR
jgi:hypothetical protein